MPAGVYVITPDGELLGRIPIPEDVCTNLAFGGPDRKTLYVTSGKTVFKVPTRRRPGMPSIRRQRHGGRSRPADPTIAGPCHSPSTRDNGLRPFSVLISSRKNERMS